MVSLFNLSFASAWATDKTLVSYHAPAVQIDGACREVQIKSRRLHMKKQGHDIYGIFVCAWGLQGCLYINLRKLRIYCAHSLKRTTWLALGLGAALCTWPLKFLSQRSRSSLNGDEGLDNGVLNL